MTRTTSAVAGIVLLAAGCGPPPPPPPLVARDVALTAAAVAAGLDARREALDTVRAGLEITWEDPRFAEPEDCRGSLSFVHPDSLRLRGVSAAFFTVFDLVAAGNQVWLDVPREELTVFGSRADEAWERLPLSPRSLLVALLAHPCPGEGCLENASAEHVDGELRLSGRFGLFAADATTGFPTRYVGTGDDPLRITWWDWSERAGVAWPQRIRIERSGDQSLTVSFGRVQLGRPVPSSRFQPEEETSREILTPRDAAERWSAR